MDTDRPTGCSKSPAFPPAQLWRAETRLGPSKAAGELKPEAYPLGYVEDFDELRTPLAGFFSILSEEAAFLEIVFVNNGSGVGGKLPTLL